MRWSGALGKDERYGGVVLGKDRFSRDVRLHFSIQSVIMSTHCTCRYKSTSVLLYVCLECSALFQIKGCIRRFSSSFWCWGRAALFHLIRLTDRREIGKNRHAICLKFSFKTSY